MNTTTDPAFEFVRQLAADLARSDFDLPPFPDTALRVREALKDPDVSIESLSRIVLSEPVLTARLLRMANSAMMRRGPIEITHVKTAIARLGLDMVQNAAVSLAAADAFRAPEGSRLRQHLDGIRKHSIKVSALAYVLAKRVAGFGKPDEAMLAGLLHAIGKFYILTRVDAYPELFANPQALEQLLNEWHVGVGRAIVESWGFPEEIVTAVDEQEVLDREKPGPADIADIVIVANFLATEDRTPDAQQPDLDQLPSVRRMRLDGATIRHLVKESDEEIRSVVHALTS